MRFARRTSWLKRTAWRLAGCRCDAATGGAARVLLTFDDGPHPEHTPAVLDRLAAFGVRATFFLVGKRVTDPGLVRRIADAGHQLGNHTFAHAVPRVRDVRGLVADVRRCQERVPGAALFRPPLGRLTPGLWFAARRLRLRCIGWSLDSGDWRCRSEADALQCAKEVLELVRPGDIVLLHDHHRWIGSILDVLLPAIAS
jgi:peptidoglycan-N-acetylglucosamine deacetylase